MLCAGGDSLFCPCTSKTAYHPIPWWGFGRSSCAICCRPGGEGECQRGKTLGILLQLLMIGPFQPHCHEAISLSAISTYETWNMHTSNPSWLRYILSFLSSLLSALQAVTHGFLNPQSWKSKNLGSAGFALVDGVLAKDRGHEFVFCHWIWFLCFTAFPFWKLRRHFLG